jgi:hypothetical protein
VKENVPTCVRSTLPIRDLLRHIRGRKLHPLRIHRVYLDGASRPTRLGQHWQFLVLVHSSHPHGRIRSGRYVLRPPLHLYLLNHLATYAHMRLFHFALHKRHHPPRTTHFDVFDKHPLRIAHTLAFALNLCRRTALHDSKLGTHNHTARIRARLDALLGVLEDNGERQVLLGPGEPRQDGYDFGDGVRDQGVEINWVPVRVFERSGVVLGEFIVPRSERLQSERRGMIVERGDDGYG